MKEQILSFLEHSAFLREHVVKRIDNDRSPEWTKIRNMYVTFNPRCAMCGSTKQLQVHHIVPFSRNAELELDPDNLITLCARDHLVFGHLGSWRSFNIDVKEDCDEWRTKYTNRPKPMLSNSEF